MKILTTYLMLTACLLMPPLVHGADDSFEPLVEVGSAPVSVTTLETDARSVIGLIERSKALQDKIPHFVDEAAQAIETHKGALPAAYSVRIAKEIAEANAIRNALFQHALRYRNVLYRVDGSIDDGERIDSILVSMAAAVALFDNAQFMRRYFSENQVLRAKLNEAYPEAGVGKNFYEDSLLRANSLPYRSSMRDAIRFFQDNQNAIALHMGEADKGMKTLYEFIEKSTALAKFGGDDVFRQISDQVAILLQRSAVGSVKQVGKLRFLTSQVVGNTLGMVRWRSGKLKEDDKILSLVSDTLQPGDILLEKTPFALTDKTIPGHFGHAAIYIGTTEQLRAIGAFDLPLVKAHQTEIDSGQVVLEALRGGVVLNTLKHFMDIDDVAVLRPQQLSLESVRDSIGLALSNFGKRYDFDFDVNTTETIVCSELVYAAYPQIDFVTKQVFTSFTISPDDIAKLATGNPSDPLGLTLFVHDGKLTYRKGENIAGLKLYRELVGLERGEQQAANDGLR